MPIYRVAIPKRISAAVSQKSEEGEAVLYDATADTMGYI
jgi:hypothetical protein